jgi:hypothetical protein
VTGPGTVVLGVSGVTGAGALRATGTRTNPSASGIAMGGTGSTTGGGTGGDGASGATTRVPEPTGSPGSGADTTVDLIQGATGGWYLGPAGPGLLATLYGALIVALAGVFWLRGRTRHPLGRFGAAGRLAGWPPADGPSPLAPAVPPAGAWWRDDTEEFAQALAAVSRPPHAIPVPRPVAEPDPELDDPMHPLDQRMLDLLGPAAPDWYTHPDDRPDQDPQAGWSGR